MWRAGWRGLRTISRCHPSKLRWRGSPKPSENVGQFTLPVQSTLGGVTEDIWTSHRVDEERSVTKKVARRRDPFVRANAILSFVESTLSPGSWRNECGLDIGPVLGPFERAIYQHEHAYRGITDVESLASYLRTFFKAETVDRVIQTHRAAEMSTLGSGYSRRGLYSTVAARLMFNITQEAGTHATSLADNVSQQRETTFTSVPITDFGLGPSTAETLYQRTKRFRQHSAIQALCKFSPGTFQLKAATTSRFVQVYHGTRALNLPYFVQYGISPPLVQNELSVKQAFYVGNSLSMAYEHPKLHHNAVNDQIAILAFHVDTHILYGLEAPGKDEKPFFVKVFDEANKEWEAFRMRNYTEKFSNDEFDVVIGPVSSPVYAVDDEGKVLPNENGQMVVIGVNQVNNGDMEYEQIGFTSERSYRWMERNLRFIVKETNQDDSVAWLSKVQEAI